MAFPKCREFTAHFAFPIGTFDIKNVEITIGDSDISVQTDYLMESNARGAFFIFVSLNSAGIPNLESAKYLALDMNSSLDFELPFSLNTGRQFVLLYDIESDGRLANGKVYPAVTKEFVVTRATTSGL